MTQFEQAVLQVEAGKINAPEVTNGTGKVDYFQYQLAVHHFNLKIMAKGMSVRGVKLSDMKKYYGLKGRTAADCLPQFEKIMDSYKNKPILN
jgi:hypothetical protein